MKILKDAFLFTLSPKYPFGRYSIMVEGTMISDVTPSSFPEATDKVQAWIEHNSGAEVIDCSNKVIMPPFVNPCLKSEGSLIKYLLHKRHYESTAGDLCTDLIFNYLYQQYPSEDVLKDLGNMYSYSFVRNLKSGIGAVNEFSHRQDDSHFQSILSARNITGQKLSVCYPIKQDAASLSGHKHLDPSYYLTSENQLKIYDIQLMTELKKNGMKKLFLEVATNKEVTEQFKHMFDKPVIKMLDEYGLIDSDTTLINPLYLTYDEMKVISEKKVNIIVCPRDLAHFTGRYFPIDDFLSRGLKFSIGTGWLGEDLFKEIRLFRQRYKELSISSLELLKAASETPAELYFRGGNTGTGIEGNNFNPVDTDMPADMVFIDLSDSRFQFLPESDKLDDLCDFFVDSLTPFCISDVMIAGGFKVRDHELLTFDENELIRNMTDTRNKLYVTGKYKELSERKQQRKQAEELELGSMEEEEILFAGISGESAVFEPENKETFRIKARIPVFRSKTSENQKNLFEESDQGRIKQAEEHLETPALNLLFSEIDESKLTEEDVVHSSVTDESIIKQARTEKKEEKTGSEGEGKIELPKDVKLKFGDD